MIHHIESAGYLFPRRSSLPVQHPFTVSANISGCTNPTALNYNSEASVDDGSCQCADSDEAVEIVLTDEYGDGTVGSGHIVLDGENIITLGAVSGSGGVAALVCATAETTYTMVYDASTTAIPKSSVMKSGPSTARSHSFRTQRYPVVAMGHLQHPLTG